MGTTNSYLAYLNPVSYFSITETQPLRKFNWIKDPKKPQESDFLVISERKTIVDLYDLTTNKQFPSIYDQGELGSCTANALSCAVSFDYLNNFVKLSQSSSSSSSSSSSVTFNPSRLYLYYKERERENDIPNDNGAILADGVNVLLSKGVCSEEQWPYIINKFSTKPPVECDTDALQHKLVTCKLVNQTQHDLESCISSGFPVVFGFVVYNDIRNISASNNFILPMPKFGEPSIGGHAVIIVGYDSTKKLFKIRNSWGEKWGDKGHFYMHYDYVLNFNLASDFWILTSMQDLHTKINQV